jgi:hypothetical protein
MPDRWPFEDPPYVAVITLKRVARGEAPVRLVAHDADDGCWQFLDGGAADGADASVVSLEEMTRIDPTLVELADLPPGWVACRYGPGAPWVRSPRGGAGAGRDG